MESQQHDGTCSEQVPETENSLDQPTARVSISHWRGQLDQAVASDSELDEVDLFESAGNLDTDWLDQPVDDEEEEELLEIDESFAEEGLSLEEMINESFIKESSMLCEFYFKSLSLVIELILFKQRSI